MKNLNGLKHICFVHERKKKKIFTFTMLLPLPLFQIVIKRSNECVAVVNNAGINLNKYGTFVLTAGHVDKNEGKCK